MSYIHSFSKGESELTVDEYSDNLSDPSSEVSLFGGTSDNLAGYERHRNRLVQVFHVVFAALNLLLFAALFRKTYYQKSNDLSNAHSPVEHLVVYESRYFDKYGHLGGNPFSQKPGPELDSAWHELLSGMNIRVSEEYLKPFQIDSIRLADGSGYLAQLGVYHELHCLKKLKHWNYRSHYYGHLSAADFKEEETHVEHCLEWLRVAALCRCDTTLTTFQWEGHNRSRLATQYPIPRQCVKSERVLGWSNEHVVNIDDMTNVLVGPEETTSMSQRGEKAGPKL